MATTAPSVTSNPALTLIREKNSITLLTSRQREATALIDEAEAANDPNLKSFAVAAAIQTVRDAFTPEMLGALVDMQGSALTFKTDRPYGAETIRDAATYALVSGVPLAGNCFNILGGNPYITKEGWDYKIRQLPFVTYHKAIIDKPEDAEEHGKEVRARMKAFAYADLSDGGRVTVTKQKGKQADDRVCVTAFKGDYDTFIGKATARILKELYEELTHRALPVPDEDSEPLPAAPRIEQSESDKWAPYRDEFSNSSNKAQELAERVIACDDIEAIRGIFSDATQYMQAGTFNQRDLDRLERLCKFAKRQLS